MYKIKLYDDEINKINNLEVFKTTKKALMSIYAYFLKLGANTKDGLKISFDDIFNRYRRWHVFTKTKANFVKLSYKLIDLGLLKVEKKGYTVLAITISEILDKLKESYNNNNSETQLNKILVAINSADLLILDDLGVEPPSPWVNNVMYRLIDSRYCSKKPMIITTNLKNYDRYDEEGRISSRISEMCKPVVVNGDDIRKVIGKAKGLDITTNLNSSNNKIDEPYEKISDNADEEKIDYKRQVIIALNSCKNIFGEKAISDFSNKDIKYIEDRIKAAPNKIQALNGFINNLKNNSKSSRLREIILDYVKSIK